jgi:hypothetical protein
MAFQARFGTRSKTFLIGVQKFPGAGKVPLLILLPGSPERPSAFGTDEFLRDPTTGDHAASYHSPPRCGSRFNVKLNGFARFGDAIA